MSAARVSASRAPAKTAVRPVTRRPAKPSAPARQNPAARWATAIALWIYRRPVPVLITVAVLGVVGSIGWNVLMRQNARHPAPLFVKAEPAHPAPAAAPLPTPRPAASAAQPPVPADKPAKADPIGSLIRTGDPAHSDAERISAVQNALSKLNYGPLKSDGVLGPGTKAAIERFERDRNLPVTGALSPRSLRALAQQSGVEIE